MTAHTHMLRLSAKGVRARDDSGLEELPVHEVRVAQTVRAFRARGDARGVFPFRASGKAAGPVVGDAGDASDVGGGGGVRGVVVGPDGRTVPPAKRRGMGARGAGRGRDGLPRCATTTAAACRRGWWWAPA